MVAEPAALAIRRDHLQLIKGGAAGEMVETEQRASEREPVVAVPLVYFQMLKGDARAATFLAQVLYHQKYKGDNEGWFYHTVAQWEDELGFSDEAEARCCKTLAAYGLKTCVKAINRTPKKHYRVDAEKLQERINDHLHLRESRKCQERRTVALQQQHKESAPPDIYGKAGSADTLRNAGDDTTGKPVNDTSVQAESPLTEKPENIDIRDKGQEIKQRDQSSDANASGGTAHADAPAAIASRSKKKAEGTKDDALNAYRSRLLGLMRESYGNHLASEGKQVAVIKRMYEARAPVESVEACWRATLIEPTWDTRSLDMATIEQRLPVFLKSPENYQRGMQRKREQQQAAEKRGNSNGTGRNFPQRAGGISQPSDAQTKAHSSRDAASLLLDDAGND